LSNVGKKKSWPDQLDTQPSWDILGNVGNLSSATILLFFQESGVARKAGPLKRADPSEFALPLAPASARIYALQWDDYTSGWHFLGAQRLREWTQHSVGRNVFRASIQFRRNPVRDSLAGLGMLVVAAMRIFELRISKNHRAI